MRSAKKFKRMQEDMPITLSRVSVRNCKINFLLLLVAVS